MNFELDLFDRCAYNCSVQNNYF